MTCPDENALVGFVRRSIDARQLADVEAHLGGCDACRAVVAQLAPDVSIPISFEPTTVGARGTAQPALLQEGTRVGRYEIVRRLGAGGMGVVYEARDPDLARSVALKVLRADQDAGSSSRARLMREAQTMASLSHRNVVALFDVGTHEGQIFLAMELVRGRTLGQWLASGPPKSQVLDIFRQAGAGLAAAHEADLVHRDFKPANVMVSEDGRALVTDFGLARASSSALPGVSGQLPKVGVENITRTGTVVGTPAYMAPEQLAGGAADPRSDQFAFCVALYEALAGVRPFEGSTLIELHAAVMAELIWPPLPDRTIPSRVRRAVLKGLRPNARDRHPSMRALLAELEEQPKRQWPLTVGVAVGMLVVVVGVLVARPLVEAPPPARTAEAAQAPSTSAKPEPTPSPVQSPEPVSPPPAMVKPAERPDPPRLKELPKTAVAKPRKPKPGGEGLLSIHVTPWGAVEVDGRPLTSANMMDYVVNLPSGRHEIAVKHPQLGSRRDSVTVEAGRTVERQINFR